MNTRPLSRPSLLVALAMAVLSPAAAAAPMNPPSAAHPSGVVVAESAACRVLLVAVSYDDPGADDAEFVELAVETLGGASGTGPEGGACSSTGAVVPSSPDTSAVVPSLPDASAALPSLPDASAAVPSLPDASAAVPSSPGASARGRAAPFGDAEAGSAGPVLGDCGLTELDPIDGAGGECSTYRKVPLGTVPVPSDGYVVICPAGSRIDVAAHCDVTTAGRAQLHGGWLQNGPNDGLRFIGEGGLSSRDVGYEGAPPCFASDAVELAAESGSSGQSADAAATDDVNVACDGRFVLLAQDEVRLRAPIACPVSGGGPGGRSDGGLGAALPDGGLEAALPDAGSDAARWVPERAPAPVSRSGSPVYGPLYVDAGDLTTARPVTLTKPPGCTVGRGSSSGGAAALLLLMAASITRRRRRSPRAAKGLPRARCDARCGSRPTR